MPKLAMSWNDLNSENLLFWCCLSISDNDNDIKLSREQNTRCVPNHWNLLYLPMSFFPLLYQHLMHSAPWLDSISASNAPGHTSTFLCFQLPTQVLQAFQSANPYPERHGLTPGRRLKNTNAWDCRVKHLPAQSTIETSMDDGIIDLVVDQRRAMGHWGKLSV